MAEHDEREPVQAAWGRIRFYASSGGETCGRQRAQAAGRLQVCRSRCAQIAVTEEARVAHLASIL
eukprot:9958054-Lingulodinium_polyedra.AAC.1